MPPCNEMCTRQTAEGDPAQFPMSQISVHETSTPPDEVAQREHSPLLQAQKLQRWQWCKEQLNPRRSG
eukprot:CAMPEP_0196162924 /NCGR_PEP_ID=MMETSP0910-20130528/48083_1 /TAXON_ID=49265 /ORGANISM="Thalassiosira rotula, Strain GSO102" /LENGTH=67 /DNA_ID=CAMNT_0041427883 /DNA_START=227 /DNA_END=430 /DNA_ORIENTATION=+